MAKKIRVLVGKPGLDGHDRGAKVVAAALRDAGMEVIYTGLHQTCESIVEAAIQEDVDVIGLSILSGAHMTLFPKVLDLLKKRKAADIMVIGGGIIPADDMKKLEKRGVQKLFGPGTPTSEIVDWIEDTLPRKKKRKSVRKRISKRSTSAASTRKKKRTRKTKK
jgi:methylmalonyl-CoA mutase C-terminal domain/subunit